MEMHRVGYVGGVMEKTKLLNGKTFLEVWLASPANDYDSLSVFGCLIYDHVTEFKIDPEFKILCFLGFSEGIEGYKL